MFYQLLDEISEVSILCRSKRDIQIILTKILYYEKENHQKVCELNIKY